MSLRSQITNDLDNLFTSENLADAVNYVSKEGVITPLVGAWEVNDIHGSMPDIESKNIGDVTFTFPISQLAKAERTATVQHPDYEKPWTIRKAYPPDSFTYQFTLTQARAHKSHGRGLNL